MARFDLDRGLVGGCAYDTHMVPISDQDMAKAQAADAVLLGAVGGPKWDGVPYDVRPENGLLRPAQGDAALRQPAPAICYPALADASSLKRELVDGLDIMIVRELTVASISVSRSRSSTSATGRSAASTPRSTTPTRSSGSVASPSSWRVSAATS